MSAARYSQVLLAPWRQRDLSAPWGRRVIAALLVVVVSASLAFLPAEAGWRVCVSTVLLVNIGLWMAVSHNLLEQNHPTAARTVPGQLHTLKRAALLGWALCTALNTALFLLMLPERGFWPLVLLCNGFLAAFLLWTTRLVWLWLLMFLVSPLSVAFGKQLAPLRQAASSAWETAPHAVLALCLLLQGWLVLRAFGGGGTAHQARYAAQAQMRRAMQMQMDGKTPAFAVWAPVEWLTRPFVRVLSAWLRHVLAQADNGNPRSVMARAEIVLHGQQHWLRVALTLGVIAAVVLACFSAVLAGTSASLGLTLQHGGFGMGIGIASAGFNPGFAISNMLWGSRREQALLRLLPGMPQGRALNLAVARLQWRDFTVAWLLTTAALFALGLGIGHQLLLCLPIAALPVAAWVLTRRPALLRPPTALTSVAPSFIFLTLALILYLLGRELAVALWAQALVIGALTAPLLAWRWQRLAAAPAALPTGRLGY